MPTPTYTPLANITLGSSAASVTFSSISQAYRDLVLVISHVPASISAQPNVRYNSDAGANYSEVYMAGNGSTTNSQAYSGQTEAYLNYYGPVGTTLFTTLSIMDYSATDKHKTGLVRANLASSGVETFAHRWASTSAITSILVRSSGSGMASGTTLALYGIAA